QSECRSVIRSAIDLSVLYEYGPRPEYPKSGPGLQAKHDELLAKAANNSSELTDYCRSPLLPMSVDADVRRGKMKISNFHHGKKDEIFYLGENFLFMIFVLSADAGA
uniref:Uncharacterized protein n=1 Tax=Romanomermis culicivorax TaxID=13658 RepID=A0A915L8V7_ROMCU